MCYMLKDKYISCLHFETQLNHEKQLILIYNDSKRRRMALSCSQKVICIIKKNNVGTSW